MKKIFQNGSIAAFLDTICCHFSKNMSNEVSLVYNISPNILFLNVSNEDVLSKDFWELFSVFKDNLVSGVFNVNFSLSDLNDKVLLLEIHINLRNTVVKNSDSLKDDLSQLKQYSIVTFNEIDAKITIALEGRVDEAIKNRITKSCSDKNILIIGNSLLLDKYVQFLDSIDTNTTRVTSGGEALELLFGDSEYDVLIMDSKESSIDGQQFKKLLHNNPAFKDQHLLLLSEADFKGYAAFLETLCSYLEGVRITTSIPIVDENDPLVFDQSAIWDRTGGNSAFIEKIISLYCKDMEKHLKILDHIDTLDSVVIQRIAHSMKGASYSCCANRVAKYAKELEMTVKRGQMEGCPLLLETIRNSFEEFCSTVKASGFLKREK